MWRRCFVLRCPQVLQIIDSKPLPNRAMWPLKSNNGVPSPTVCRNINLFEFSAFYIFLVISYIKAVLSNRVFGYNVRYFPSSNDVKFLWCLPGDKLQTEAASSTETLLARVPIYATPDRRT